MKIPSPTCYRVTFNYPGGRTRFWVAGTHNDALGAAAAFRTQYAYGRSGRLKARDGSMGELAYSKARNRELRAIEATATAFLGAPIIDAVY